MTRVRCGPGPIEAVAALTVLVGFEFAMAHLVAAPRSRGGALALTGGIRILETGLGLLWWRLRGWDFAPLGLTGTAGRRGLTIGGGVALGFAALVGTTEIAGRLALDRSFLTLVARSLPRPGVPYYPLLLLVGGVVAPLAEEFWFRAILYGALRKTSGTVIATILVTTLFTLAHIPQAHIPWTQAVGGIVFCAAYEIGGSLWAPIVVHVTGNLALFLLPLVTS